MQLRVSPSNLRSLVPSTQSCLFVRLCLSLFPPSLPPSFPPSLLPSLCILKSASASYLAIWPTQKVGTGTGSSMPPRMPGSGGPGLQQTCAAANGSIAIRTHLCHQSSHWLIRSLIHLQLSRRIQTTRYSRLLTARCTTPCTRSRRFPEHATSTTATGSSPGDALRRSSRAQAGPSPNPSGQGQGQVGGMQPNYGGSYGSRASERPPPRL